MNRSIQTTFGLRFHAALEAVLRAGRTGADATACEAPVLDYLATLEQSKEQAEHAPGVAAEIDDALGIHLGLTGRPADGLEALLRDLSALWVGTYFRLNTRPLPEYYRRWTADHRPARGGEFTEYACLLDPHAEQILQTHKISIVAKAKLFAMFGRVLVDHGYVPEGQVGRLDGATPLGAAGLLDLQALVTAGHAIPWVEQPGHLALRHWAAHQPLAAYLFQRWGILCPAELEMAPTQMEQASIERVDGTLFREYRSGESPRGTVRLVRQDAAGVELDPASVPRAGERHCFRRLPVVLIGREHTGKTSLVQAARTIVERRSSDGRIRCMPGRAVQALGSQQGNEWVQGEPSRTKESQLYDIDVVPERHGEMAGPVGMPVQLIDTVGQKIGRPENFDDATRWDIDTAAAMIFTLDVSDGLADFTGARALALWMAQLLYQWRLRHPGRRHIPVLVLLNQADRFLGLETLLSCRPNMIPSEADRMLLHAGADGSGRLGGSPHERLTRAIRQDRATNYFARYQGLADRFLEAFEPMLHQVSLTSYRIGIYLTAALPPRAVDDAELPYGVSEALGWLFDAQYEPFLRQAPREVGAEAGRLRAIRSGLDTELGRLEDLIARRAATQKHLERLQDAQLRRLRTPMLGKRLRAAETRLGQLETALRASLEGTEGHADLVTEAGLSPECRIARVRSMRAALDDFIDHLDCWKADLESISLPKRPAPSFAPIIATAAPAAADHEPESDPAETQEARPTTNGRGGRAARRAANVAIAPDKNQDNHHPIGHN